MTRWLTLASALCAILIAPGFTPGRTDSPSAAGVAPDTTKPGDDSLLIAHELQELHTRIAGREKDPAPQVFKNIRLFTSMEAGRVPGVMGSWCRTLGVTCKHCHVIDQWEKEDRPEKQIARDMSAMVMEINTHLLKNIKNLDSPEPRIGCWTCHRGKLMPEFFPPRPRKD